jgi:selenocysteine-specific elongation factor
METVAEVRLHGAKQVAPGSQGCAQLRLAEPTLLLPGDRFILRQFSPVVTIGGGMVLDATPLRRSPAQEEFLKIMAGGNATAILRARIARRHHDGISLAQLTAETGWPRNEIERHLGAALQQGNVVRLGDLLVHAAALEGLGLCVLTTVESFHKRNPLVAGISKEELRDTVNASPETLSAVLERLAREKKLEASGEAVHLPGRGVVMKDEEAESKKMIEQAFASAGLKVPSLKEVLSGLKVDKLRAQKIVTLLLRDKVLIKISDELVFHQTALADLRQKIAVLKTNTPKIDVARFKDLTGVSRKYAIPLLEYLDRERVTKRIGDERAIL